MAWNPGAPAPTDSLPTDPTQICFRADYFLAQYPAGLPPAAVFDYLKLSPFYDQTDKGEPTPGVEYVIHHAQEPSLYIIRKQIRSGPDNVKHKVWFHCPH